MRLKSKFIRAVALVLVLLLFAGCGKTTAVSQKDVATRPFTDSSGRTVEVPENITRVVVTGQLAQILVFSLAPDKLVAIASEWSSDAQQYIDEKYFELPVMGQLFGGNSNINIEELAAVAPDVVIDIGETKTGMAEELDTLQEQIGTPCVHIAASLETMDEAYEMLGDLLGMEAEAEELSKFCVSTYDMVSEVMETVDETGRKTVLYCLGDMGCNVIAANSYQSEILDMLTDNMAQLESPSSKGTGNEVDMEQIYIWNPEVIFFAPESYFDYAADDPEWQALDAIKNDTYYEVPYGIYNWMGFPPSVQRYLGMMWMAKILYPNVADYDLYELVSEFYSRFFHCKLTKEQYLEMTENSIGKLEGQM